MPTPDERRAVLAQIEAGWARQTRRPTAGEVDAWIGFGREGQTDIGSDFVELTDDSDR